MALHPIKKGKTAVIGPFLHSQTGEIIQTPKQSLRSYMIWIKDNFGPLKYSLQKRDNGHLVWTALEDKESIKP